MTVREIFATNLRRLRKRRQLSQEALAHEAGIDRTYVSALERQQYSASLDMLELLAVPLGVQVHQLLDPDFIDSV